MLILANSLWELIRGGIAGFFTTIFTWIFLFIDTIIYYGVSLAYRVFIALASARLFGSDETFFRTLTEKVYVVIGVVALFLVAYALLVAIINPDNANKGDKSLGKLFPNIALAIVGIAIVPTVFNWAYKAQDLILCNNVIQKLMLENDDDSVNAYANAGAKMATTLFQSFFHATDGNNPSTINSSSGVTLASAYEQAESGSPFTIFLGFTDSVVDNKIEYIMLFSTVAGAFACYVLIVFCFDMAVRLFKLAYLQVIAPLPILTIIIPGQKKVFQNWLKKSVSCFIEVFVRIFCLVFVVILVNNLPTLFGDLWMGSCASPSGIVRLLVYAFIVVGLFGFLKQAPKLISDVTGMDSKGFKLGIKDKLAESGVFQAVGAVGGGLTAGVRNFAATGNVLSAAAGLASGVGRGFKAGKDAKSFTDARNAAGKAADAAVVARYKRAGYKADHGGTFTGAMFGHLNDTKNQFVDWFKDDRARYSYLDGQYKETEKVGSAKKSMDDKVNDIKEKNVDRINVGKGMKWKDSNGVEHIANGDSNLGSVRMQYEHYKDQAKKTGDANDIKRAQDWGLYLNSLEKEANKSILSGMAGLKADGNLNDSLLIEMRKLQTAVKDNADVLLSRTTNETERKNLENVISSIKSLNLDDSNNINQQLAKELSTLANNEGFGKISKELGDSVTKVGNSLKMEMNEISEKQRAKEEKK